MFSTVFGVLITQKIPLNVTEIENKHYSSQIFGLTVSEGSAPQERKMMKLQKGGKRGVGRGWGGVADLDTLNTTGVQCWNFSPSAPTPRQPEAPPPPPPSSRSHSWRPGGRPVPSPCSAVRSPPKIPIWSPKERQRGGKGARGVRRGRCTK